MTLVVGLIFSTLKMSFTHQSVEKMNVQVIHGYFSREEKFSDDLTVKRVAFYTKLSLSGSRTRISLFKVFQQLLILMERY